ncbi:autotransporter-associated beta strand repeat-containing protein [Paraglaciecola aquimarina]|uniref:Autotransporter-associated beta strand repeat-containing protein n=1 Tax=Paraglaciecola algarum TaxID=3050085 RepID=A0ABS9DAR7_9ALTE|nr:autotransporter-associated beta strand repeat-containing protein [Paraglaciecola sp. G1-23]MCF2948894.1 autotransporter-associated beta strand repeat-containing protein [Paraglaciecola sp. G1-23]
MVLWKKQNSLTPITHSNSIKKIPQPKIISALLASLFITATVQADTKTWVGARDINWATLYFLPPNFQTNWQNNEILVNGDSISFDANSNAASNNNYEDIDLVNIEFKSSLSQRHNITGNQIDLKAMSNGDGIHNDSSSTQKITNTISLQGNKAITFHTSGILDMGGKITDRVLFEQLVEDGKDTTTLRKTGSGDLWLRGDSGTMHGDIAIESGTLVLREGGNLSTRSTINISEAGRLNMRLQSNAFGGLEGDGYVLLDYNDMDVGANNKDTTFNGRISGTKGNLIKSGDGTLTLTGYNSFSGLTTVNSGTLAIRSGGNIESGLVVNGGTFDIGDETERVASVQFLSGSIIGSGSLYSDDGVFDLRDGYVNAVLAGNSSIHKSGDGKVVLGGNKTYSGGIFINKGTLEGSAINLRGDIYNDGNLTLNQAEAGPFTHPSAGLYANNITGRGSVTKTGAGISQIIGSASTYSGQTNVEQGTLNFLGQGTSSGLSGVRISSGANVQVDGDNTFAYLTGDGDIRVKAGDLTINSKRFSIYNGDITGNGGLVKSGNAIQRLLGNNSYYGGTVINEGTLEGNARSIQGDIVNNAKLILNQSNDGYYNVSISGSGSVRKKGNGTAYLTHKNNSYSGETKIDLGTIAFDGEGTSSDMSGLNIGGSASLSVKGDNTVRYLIGDGKTHIESGKLTINNDSNYSYSGDISGAGGLMKSGSGTQTLNGENTYAGDTTVVNGTLHIGSSGSIHNQGVFTQVSGQTIVDGTLKQGSFDIQGGSISGSGIVKANKVIVGENASINPGNSPGTLILTGDLDLNGTLTTEIYSASVHDMLFVEGILALTDTSNFDFMFDNNYQVSDGDSFKFLNAFNFDFGTALNFDDWFDMDAFSVDGLAAGIDWSITYFDGSGLQESSYMSLLLSDNRSTGSTGVSAPGTLVILALGLLGILRRKHLSVH